MKELIGLVLQEINVDTQSDEITFTSESVNIEDVEGDINDLIGSPIVVAESVDEAIQQAINLIIPLPEKSGECEQWTFYRLATAKGWGIIRGYGDSNGYYSTDVSFERLEPETT